MTERTEKERILALEITQNQMAQDISEIKSEVKEINAKFDIMLEKMEKKFASKWVEWVIKGMVWLILLTVFWTILHMVIIK